MLPGRVAFPLLLLAVSCNPLQEYQQAARSLRFTLERVEPSLELAFPPDRSRIRFECTLGVENPSAVPFHIQGFDGALRLEHGGNTQPLGQIALERPLDLPAGGRTSMVVSVAFGYKDLQAAWPDLEQAVTGRGTGAWELEGRLRAQTHGLSLSLPVRSRRTFGTAP
jgi:LEA14-like dessication related protein